MTKQKAYHHGDLRAALVESARAIVDEKGPDDVSLRGVAEAAGVSRAAPYHHFQDKQALLAAVAAVGFHELAALMLSKVDPTALPRTRLDQLGFGYVEFGILNPMLFRLMQGPAFQVTNIYPDLDKARGASAAPLIDTVAACIPDQSEGRIMTACAAAWSIVHGMAMLAIDGRLQSLIDVSNLSAASVSITSQLVLLNEAG